MRQGIGCPRVIDLTVLEFCHGNASRQVHHGSLHHGSLRKKVTMSASRLSSWLSHRPWQARWSRLSITRKFTFAFGLFAVLIVFMALTGYMALRGVRKQSEEVLASSMQAQQVVLEMRVLLEQARRLERDFILSYPEEGLEYAVDTYANAVNDNLDTLEAMSRQLNRQLLQLEGVITTQDVNSTMPTMRDIATAPTTAPTEDTETTETTETTTAANNTNQENTPVGSTEVETSARADNEAMSAADITATVISYLSVARGYREAFNEAVSLVEQLATARTGVQPIFEQRLTVLRFRLELTNNPNLNTLYFELLAASKEYLLSRQERDMRAVLRLTDSITRNLELMLNVDDTTRQQALDAMADVVVSAEALLELDQTIRVTLAGFDVQASTLDDVATDLVAFVSARADQAQAAIASATRSATVALFVAVIAASLLTVLVAALVKTTITDNLLALGRTAQALRQGDWRARVEISSHDEIGALAESVNDMASQLSLLVTDLEAQVNARTANLNAANERISQLNAQLQDDNLRMERELDVTRKLQQMVLPSEHELAAIPMLDIAP
jgi:methyl-accepting chemotaxis protein